MNTESDQAYIHLRDIESEIWNRTMEDKESVKFFSFEHIVSFYLNEYLGRQIEEVF
jgi:hypothetical protein